MIGRIAALSAVGLALVAVIAIVLSAGSTYQVKAIFQNASQLVTGNQVQVAGNSIGSVSNIALTPNGQAELTLSIDDSSYSPLREGTLATVRLTSLSGIANRYVDLRLGPSGAPAIPSGGTIGTTNTTSAVDLDELFNTLDAPTRKGLQNVIQGSASQYQGQGQQMQAAWQYLNPAVVSSAVLFSELNRDTGKFTNFLVQSSNLVSDLSQRSSDLSGLVANLGATTQALAAQRGALGESIQRLPGVMALADTTFVNLRQALDRLTPLVDAAKPVAPKLQKLLTQLRPLAIASVPTVRDLANIVSRPGAGNDLTELTRLGVPLAAVACGSAVGAGSCTGTLAANGRQRLGALPQSTIALNDSTPELATARPYAVDLTGWFEGYAHPGVIDANGSTSRIAPVIALSAVDNEGVSTTVPSGVAGFLAQFLGTGAPGGHPLLTLGQGDRCPGSMERGGLWYPEPGFPCNPSEVPTGR
ncbi:MAG: MCE family protein [Solirubrobacterales bacterium]|nr:MCE family protein [Solirubrobacterales bacterium]MBV9715075.1 MCE family protein [Solirubrobacterales bacterium]